jgi:hypothetical protein
LLNLEFSRNEDQKGLFEEVAFIKNLKDKEFSLQRSGEKALWLEHSEHWREW